MTFQRTRTRTVDCTCTPRRAHGETPHGYYEHACGCDACLAAFRASKPAPLTVPVGPVRAHLAALIEAGWTQQRIAHRSGYSKQTVHNVYRHNARINALVAEDLLSLGAS